MAFWVQTMIALNIEKKRKDYWQMFAHHVITVLLCTLSYAANWTRVGNLILCIMDMVDILLPVSTSTFSNIVLKVCDGLTGSKNGQIPRSSECSGCPIRALPCMLGHHPTHLLSYRHIQRYGDCGSSLAV